MSLMLGVATVASISLPALPPPGALAAAKGPFATVLEAAQLAYPGGGEHLTADDWVIVHLPPGKIGGVSIQGGGGWSPLDPVEPWWGEATMIVVGHPAGTVIEPAHDEPGWGSSLAVRPSPDWTGRIWFVDLKIQASGGNAVDIGFWGQPEKQPLLDVRFIGCRFVDHPDPDIRCVRPVSANQAAISFHGCIWDLPNSVEHAVYNRNSVGISGMYNCWVKAVGGQVWQEVNRPEEGPNYKGGRTILANSWFENYHRDEAKAGSALTFAGSGRDVWVHGCVLLDVERPDGEPSYGAFVAWDGGTYYTLGGKPILPGQKPKVGEYSNRTIRFENNLVVHKDPNRSLLEIDSSEYSVVRDNAFYGTRPVELFSHVDGGGKATDGGLGGAFWNGNNASSLLSVALSLGVDAELLVEPELKVKDEPVGKASKNVSL